MQISKKSSVEGDKNSARPHKASEHRSAQNWQSLLLMLIMMLNTHYCLKTCTITQRNLQHWQELESSSERQKANEKGTISNALRVRDKLSGREYACSNCPQVSKLHMQSTNSNLYGVHNLQNGRQHVIQEKGGRKRNGYEPGGVSVNSFCEWENYWASGECIRELITLETTNVHVKKHPRKKKQERKDAEQKSKVSREQKDISTEKQKTR